MTHLWPIEDKLEAARSKKIQTQSVLTSRFVHYQHDPIGYAQNVLKAKLTREQEEMLTSIRDNRYTAVKASHAIGKTFTAAIASNWWYDCWEEHIVYVTAPTWPQALGLTFKQLKRQRRFIKLSGRILETGVVLDEDKTREPAHFIRALNAERGEGFQGEHSAPILIVIEEGPGVPRYIWEAAGGLMTHPDSRIFAIGNPTDEATDFGQACESPQYEVQSISALDHPNIAAELNCQPPPFPDAVRLRWLYEMLENECDHVDYLSEDAFEFYALPEIEKALQGQPLSDTAEKWYYLPTAYFQGRVLGEFPTQADQQVIPKNWLKTQPVLAVPDDRPEIGCDIARFGDDRTTIPTRRGPCVLSLKELRKMDNEAVEMALKDAALDAARIWKGEDWWRASDEKERIKVAKEIPVKIDVTGGLGTGPYDHLKNEGYAVVAVNSSNSAINDEQYPNRRSELWFDTRDRAKRKRLDLSRLPKDVRERLKRELSTPKYSVKSGRKVVEDKAEMKKRLGHSPDLADGVNLAFAPETRKSTKLSNPSQSTSVFG